MIFALARPPLARLTRMSRRSLPIAGLASLAIVHALVSRASTGGADHALRGAFGALVLPLLAYSVVGVTLGGDGLRASLRGIVALGASPARAGLASIVAAMAAAGVLSGLVGGAVCMVGHGTSDAPLAFDLPASVGVALLAGATYGGLFCVGAAVGRGALRSVLLVLDFVLGAQGGLGALVTPRGHVASLLGGPLCFELPRRASSWVLLALALAYLGFAFGLAARRGGR